MHRGWPSLDGGGDMVLESGGAISLHSAWGVAGESSWQTTSMIRKCVGALMRGWWLDEEVHALFWPQCELPMSLILAMMSYRGPAGMAG
jgi:hypothetical protein